MPRPYSINNILTQIAKIDAQEKRDQEKKERELRRKTMHLQNAAFRNKTLVDKESKQIYLESRLEETENANKELLDRINELRNILNYTLDVTNKIYPNSLRIYDKFKEFTLPPELQYQSSYPSCAHECLT